MVRFCFLHLILTIIVSAEPKCRRTRSLEECSNFHFPLNATIRQKLIDASCCRYFCALEITSSYYARYPNATKNVMTPSHWKRVNVTLREFNATVMLQEMERATNSSNITRVWGFGCYNTTESFKEFVCVVKTKAVKKQPRCSLTKLPR